MFWEKRQKFNSGTELDRVFEKQHRQMQQLKRRIFVYRPIVLTFLAIILFGSFAFLVELSGYSQVLQRDRDGFLFYFRCGLLVAAFTVYAYLFAKGALVLARKIGLHWIFD